MVEKSSSVPSQPWAAPVAPPQPTAVDTLPPPTLPPPQAPSPTVRGTLPTLPGPQRPGLRDVFPFRWVDFILPTVAGLLGLLNEGDVGVRVGSALFFFVTILAMTGLILFPIRYYRRRSNPYRVARNLLISNVVFALVASVAGFLIAESVVETGDTVNETRATLRSAISSLEC